MFVKGIFLVIEPPIVDCIDSHFSVVFSFACRGLQQYCMCCTWHWPPTFASVYNSRDTRWEALKVSKIHVQFQGVYDLTSFWMYYANIMYVKTNFLSYVVNHYWPYLSPIFCNFCICVLWNTCRCMYYTWLWPLILTGVYNSRDADWEALKAFKIHMRF